jgi:hypothetical protein
MAGEACLAKRAGWDPFAHVTSPQAKRHWYVLPSICRRVGFALSTVEQDIGVGDGDRTRDIRCHRPTLYQLSYAHQRINRGQFTLKPASIEMGGNLERSADHIRNCGLEVVLGLALRAFGKTLKYMVRWCRI